MKETELKPCPFCGGKAKLHQRKVYLDNGYLVRCQVCNVRTNIILVNHPKATAFGVDESTRYTDQQARFKAAKAWNYRIS